MRDALLPSPPPPTPNIGLPETAGGPHGSALPAPLREAKRIIGNAVARAYGFKAPTDHGCCGDPGACGGCSKYLPSTCQVPEPSCDGTGDAPCC